MTVQTTTSTQSFLGDGVTKTFPFSFKFESTAHIFARYVLPGPTFQPLAPFVDYNVAGAAGNVGGTLTTTVPVPLGVVLQIYRLVPLTQLLDYVANDQFPAEASETALDLIVEGIQQINDSVTGAIDGTLGGITSILNLGGFGSVGLFDAITGTTASFLSLEAGANITLTDTGQTVRIDATGGGAVAGVLLAANNLSDVASLQQSIDNITQATTAPNEYVWTKDTATGKGKWKVVPTGAAGEANTMSSLGGTASIVGTKSGVNLPVRGFTAGANIALTQRANDILIDASAAGEANLGVNLGVGFGAYAGKSGVTLQFKGHAPGLGISMSANSTDITTAINQAASLTWTGIESFVSHADPGIGGIGLLGGSMTDAPMQVRRTAPVAVNNEVRAASLIVNVVPPGCRAFGENGLYIAMTDHAVHTGSDAVGQNCGQQTYITRDGDAHTWGGVFGVSGAPGGTGAMYGLELSIQQDSTNLAARRVLIGAFYGSKSNVPSKHTGGFLIRPFDPPNSQLGYGVSVEIGKVDQSFLSSAQGQSAFAATGTYSAAAIDLGSVTSTPIAMAMAGGSALLFGSGKAGNAAGTQTWYPGAFVPAFSGALRIYVDGTPEYIPTCSNHP